MSTTTRRVTAALTSGLLAVGLTTAPASALRLVPVDPGPTASATAQPTEDPSLLLNHGRLATHRASTERKQSASSAQSSTSPTKAQIEHEERAAMQEVARPTKAQIEHEERAASQESIRPTKAQIEHDE
ncbi:MAG: hypothetical protein WCA29_11200 [Jiangellales bacterium]